MAKIRTHNEWFREVSLENRKSCPTCHTKKLDNYIHGENKAMTDEEKIIDYCKKRGLYFLGISETYKIGYFISPTPHLYDAKVLPTLRSIECIWGKLIKEDLALSEQQENQGE